MTSTKKIGVALSGGGYRAAVYHLGTLKKLHYLGVLDNVEKLSTISGGSITGAAYCLHEGDFKSFEEKMFNALTNKSVIGYVLRSWKFIRVVILALAFVGFALSLQFTHFAILSIPIIILFFYLLVKFQFKLFPVSEIIEKAYDEFFYSGKVLSQLCEKPELAIGSTNLQTQRPFTFSKRKMEDSLYAHQNNPILFDGKNFPISRAVIASSCVPFAFTPISIDKKFYQNPEQYEDVDPKLVDGGVYDNQGAHKLTQKNSSYKCDVVIISDAGNKLPFAKLYNNTFTLLLRTVDLFMVRIKHFQMIQNLYTGSDIAVSFQSIGWDLHACIPGFYNNMVAGNIPKELCLYHEMDEDWIESPKDYKNKIMEHLETRCNYKIIKSNNISPERLNSIRSVGTNLTPIHKELAKDLMSYAESMTEVQVRLYCPEIIENNAI
jgi:NTE family protein